MNRKILFHICITIVFLLFLCSCSANDKISEVTGATGPTGTAAAVIETEAETETGPQPDTAASVTTAASGLPGSKKPATVSEIVACFNSAANKVKADKPGYSYTVIPETDENKIAISDNVPFRGFIKKFIASAISKSGKDTATVKKGESHNDYPVKGYNWASKLEPEALTGATLSDKGSYYELEMKFREEKLPALPDKPEETTHGKAFTLLLNQEFRKAFGDFNVKLPGLTVKVSNKKFAPVYKGSTIRCQIEKSTGRMITATYFLNTYSDVDTTVEVNNKTTVIGIKMEYSVTEQYDFN